MMVLEKTITNRILKYLRLRGAYAEKMHGDATQPAVLDIICCYKSLFLSFEVKRDEKLKPTPRQSYIISAINKAGGWAEKVSSVAEVKAVLDAIDEGESHSAS